MQSQPLKFQTSAIFLGFALQYNFYFSAEYLWLNFWSGSGLRTTVSFIAIAICVLAHNFGSTLKIPFRSAIPALLFYPIYGLSIGGISNTPSMGMLAEGVFWIEITLYFIIFSNFDDYSLSRIARAITIYSSVNAIASIVYFWTIREDIAVAALVGDQRIVRIADMLAPLLVFLHLLHNVSWPNRKLSIAWLSPLAIVILLGMFRSIWAALLISYATTRLIYLDRHTIKKLAITCLTLVLGVFAFERAYEEAFSVKDVILGRIVAGIGTEDSLGRISSVAVVFEQFASELTSILFGAGFGKMVWYINDFGDGEVWALQPVGALSNFYMVFLYQVGVVLASIYALYFIYCATWINKNHTRKTSQLLLFAGIYLAIQWLTFPTSNHYPIALVIGLFFTLADRKSRRKSSTKTQAASFARSAFQPHPRKQEQQ